MRRIFILCLFIVSTSAMAEDQSDMVALAWTNCISSKVIKNALADMTPQDIANMALGACKIQEINLRQSILQTNYHDDKKVDELISSFREYQFGRSVEYLIQIRTKYKDRY